MGSTGVKYKRAGNSTEVKQKLATLEQANSRLLARNLELYNTIDALAVAVENHRLNSQIADSVNERLWKTFGELIDFSN